MMIRDIFMDFMISVGVSGAFAFITCLRRFFYGFYDEDAVPITIVVTVIVVIAVVAMWTAV